MHIQAPAGVVTMLWLALLLTGCARSGTITNHAEVSAATGPTIVEVDIAYAMDERDLVRTASLVIVGTPRGQPDEAVLESNSMLANFPQTVQVLEVLKGDTRDDTIRIARTGLSTQGRANGGYVAEDVRGPLALGRYVLFLQPSGDPRFWEIVGHASGELRLDAAGRVTDVRPEAAAFEHLNRAELRQAIGRLSAAH